jgi:histone arginine demethylase JMJD6
MHAVTSIESLRCADARDAERAAQSTPQHAARLEQRVDRRARLSARELHFEYALPGRPVILTDAVERWPAMQRFTWDLFATTYGHLRKEVRGQSYTLAQIIEWIHDPEERRPAPYPFNLNVEHYFPELARDLQPELAFGVLDRLNHPLLPRVLMTGTEPYELFFGGRGCWFPRIHFDALWLHTQITQIRGSKEFFLYPPEQGRLMYPDPDNEKMSRVDFGSPDPQQFPLFFEARPIVETVSEGETLLFPAGWWHATRIHEPCMSLGKVQLNAFNWPMYVSDAKRFWRRHHPLAGRLVGPYLGMVGPLMDVQERRRAAAPQRQFAAFDRGAPGRS